MTPFQITSGDAIPHIEDRLTTTDKIGQGSADDGQLAYAYWWLGYGEQWAEEHPGSASSLTYSVVWRCVNWISQTIASLGWGVFEKKDRKRCQIDPAEDTIAWLLGMQANSEVDAFNWRQTTLTDALLWGNGYSELETDGFGRMRNMWRLDCKRVCPDRDSRGNLIYEVENGTGVKNTILLPNEIFHLRGPSEDGIVGRSRLDFARKAITSGLSQEQFGLSFFKRGPMPGGVLTIPGNISPEAKKEQRESFERVYGGRRNVGRVVVLTGGNTFTPLVLPNKDAEWIESRRFEVVEICRFFDVPPHKVMDLSDATNNNIEHQAIEAVQDCLLPWCRRLESEADIKLFGRVQRGKRYTRLNLASLLRGDTIAQTTSVTQKVNAGLMTPNEGREYFDLNPVDEGDDLLVQGAMIPLEQLSGDESGEGEDGAGELLEVPDYRQHFSYDCGAACTHSVADFYDVGGGRTEDDYIRELGTTPTEGTDTDAIIDWFNDNDLFVTSGRGMTIEDLKAICGSGAPVICPVQMYGDAADAAANRSGHYVTVNCVGMGIVCFMDPEAGQQMLPEDDFDAIWHDIDADDQTVDDHFGIAVYDEAPVPEPPPPPAPPAPAPRPAMPKPPGRPPDSLAATFTTLLRDCYSRLLRVEADKAKRADGRGALKAWAKDYFNGDSLERVTDTLLPVVEALLHAMHADPQKSRDIAGLLAGLHNSDSLTELQGKGTAGICEWETKRAEMQAADHINQIWKIVNNGAHP